MNHDFRACQKLRRYQLQGGAVATCKYLLECNGCPEYTVSKAIIHLKYRPVKKGPPAATPGKLSVAP